MNAFMQLVTSKSRDVTAARPSRIGPSTAPPLLAARTGLVLHRPPPPTPPPYAGHARLLAALLRRPACLAPQPGGLGLRSGSAPPRACWPSPDRPLCLWHVGPTPEHI